MVVVLARLVLTCLVVLTVGAARAEAQTFTVSNSSDSGDGSLRAAVAAAGDGDSVAIPASVTAPIVLTSGQIAINKSITITGAGSALTVLDGNHASRVFDIASDGVSHPEVTISDLTITHGHTTGVPGGGGAVVEPLNTLHLVRVVMTANDTAPGGDAGGAVFNQGGTLTLDRSTISGNTSGSDGGGVFGEAFMGGPGNTTISDSTISGNTTPFGRFGGGAANFGGTMAIQRSTLSGNTSGRAGGGVSTEGSGGGALTLVDSTVTDNTTNGAGFEGAAVYVLVSGGPRVLLLNDTIAGNSAFPGDAMHPGSPGGLSANDTSGTQVINTIVAGNFGKPGEENCLAGMSLAEDHNLEDLNTCGFRGAGDITGSDPLLTALEDNGGPTLTRQPIPNSPAIGAADATRCPATDQRGVPYFAPNPCDIGAVDTARPAPPGVVTGSGAPPTGAAISRFGLRPTRFAAAGRGGSIARKRRTGTTVTYRQFARGRTTFVVRALRRGRHFVKVGGFSRAGKAGSNRFHFTGRVKHHKLRPGRYRLDASAGTGSSKRTVRRAFRIVR